MSELRCELCIHMRLATKADKFIEPKMVKKGARHWCAVNDQLTKPELLRCGGDDFEPKQKPKENRAI